MIYGVNTPEKAFFTGAMWDLRLGASRQRKGTVFHSSYEKWSKNLIYIYIHIYCKAEYPIHEDPIQSIYNPLQSHGMQCLVCPRPQLVVDSISTGRLLNWFLGLAEVSNPEGLSIQSLGLWSQKAIKRMVLSTRVLKYWVLDPLDKWVNSRISVAWGPRCCTLAWRSIRSQSRAQHYIPPDREQHERCSTTRAQQIKALNNLAQHNATQNSLN